MVVDSTATDVRRREPMATDQAFPSRTLDREQTATLFGRTMVLVGVTAGFFAVGAYLARDLPPLWGLGLLVAAVVALFALEAAVDRSERVALAVLSGFGVLFGAALAPTVGSYAGADPQTLVLAAVATGLFIAGFGAAGYATRRDLSGLARTLFWALVALIAFGVVLLFVQVPGGALIYAVVGLVIFAGLTSLDFQRLRRSKDIRTAPVMAALIFLDILNVFLLFLSLFRGGVR
jgi:modulator of FtsH protease